MSIIINDPTVYTPDEIQALIAAGIAQYVIDHPGDAPPDKTLLVVNGSSVLQTLQIGGDGYNIAAGDCYLYFDGTGYVGQNFTMADTPGHLSTVSMCYLDSTEFDNVQHYGSGAGSGVFATTDQIHNISGFVFIGDTPVSPPVGSFILANQTADNIHIKLTGSEGLVSELDLAVGDSYFIRSSDVPENVNSVDIYPVPGDYLYQSMDRNYLIDDSIVYRFQSVPVTVVAPGDTGTINYDVATNLFTDHAIFIALISA